MVARFRARCKQTQLSDLLAARVAVLVLRCVGFSKINTATVVVVDVQ
jgi:hypothetical protein